MECLVGLELAYCFYDDGGYDHVDVEFEVWVWFFVGCCWCWGFDGVYGVFFVGVVGVGCILKLSLFRFMISVWFRKVSAVSGWVDD